MSRANLLSREESEMQLTFDGIELTFDESVVDASPDEIRRQVRAFEEGDRREFDLDVSIPESFTGRVMTAMAEIPYGETRTYGDLAAQIGSSPIAVGQACGRNPVPIVVPCHRVVGANSLGGFSAGGENNLDLKRALLTHEGGLDSTQMTLSEIGSGADRS